MPHFVSFKKTLFKRLTRMEILFQSLSPVDTYKTVNTIGPLSLINLLHSQFVDISPLPKRTPAHFLRPYNTDFASLENNNSPRIITYI